LAPKFELREQATQPTGFDAVLDNEVRMTSDAMALQHRRLDRGRVVGTEATRT
jgi:hypothetical protein